MENKVMIVDEQTGRIMDGRRYSDGLTKPLKQKKRRSGNQTFATITLQPFPHVPETLRHDEWLQRL